MIAKSLALIALAAFKDYPQVDHLFVTEDGNAFLPEHKNMAENHARQARIPAPVMVTREEIGAPGVEKDTVADTDPDKNAASDLVEPVGSEEYGDTVSIKGKKVPIADIVAKAMVMQEFTVEAWNALSQKDRELYIDGAIDELKA